MEQVIQFALNRLEGQLLRLFADLDDASPLIPAPVDTISTVLKEIWSWSNSGEPNEIVLGFFSQILPLSGHSTNILNVWGNESIPLRAEGLCSDVQYPGRIRTIRVRGLDWRE